MQDRILECSYVGLRVVPDKMGCGYFLVVDLLMETG